jgi:hypothetical protein
MLASATSAIARWLSLALAALLAAGCQEPTLPDPNDPEDMGEASPNVLKQDLLDDYLFFQERVKRGEITPDRAQQLLQQDADQMISHIDLKRIPVADAWQFGDVFRTGDRWDLARAAYEVAAKHAKTEDRRVNDTLRLALSMAHLGQIREAIAMAGTIMDASPKDSAPILPAVLLEIVPAAEGRGADLELARLLDEAIRKHLTTVVDPNSDAGKAFLLARDYHVSHAWDKVVELYRAAGRDDLAEDAMKRGIEWSKTPK